MDRRLILVVSLCVLLVSAGCSPGAPRIRVGSIPCPGAFTLFRTADPDQLGIHHYGWLPRGPIDEWETERGIVYTSRAGFLDIAHIRNTVDWARFVQQGALRAIDENADSFDLRGHDPTTWTIAVAYPQGWHDMSDSERADLELRAANSLAAHVAYLMMTWHEIITWFGYRSTVLFSETGSAFTYDDTMSHIVGSMVAQRALAAPPESYDAAVTESLDEALQSLGVVSPEVMMEAMQEVKGEWFESGAVSALHLDVGLDDGLVTPMIVTGISHEHQSRAEFPVPTMSEVEQLGWSFDITVHTGILEGGAVRRAAGVERGQPLTVNELQSIMAHIMRAEMGETRDAVALQ